MLEEYDFTNARKNPYIQREGGAADEQADEHSRLAGSLQPVACGGAERRPAPVFLQQHSLSRAINVKGIETRGKNENAVRSFVLSDVARAVLEAQRAITGHCESVFCLETERRYYKRWKVYCAANDLQPVSLYELRHTFVSVVKTLPAGEVKELVGHSEDMDTFGIYSHTLTGEDIATAQAVNAVFLKLLQG